MDLGLEKLSIENLKAFGVLMKMGSFGKKEPKKDIVKKIQEHLIWAFSDDDQPKAKTTQQTNKQKQTYVCNGISHFHTHKNAI